MPPTPARPPARPSVQGGSPWLPLPSRSEVFEGSLALPPIDGATLSGGERTLLLLLQLLHTPQTRGLAGRSRGQVVLCARPCPAPALAAPRCLLGRLKAAACDQQELPACEEREPSVQTLRRRREAGREPGEGGTIGTRGGSYFPRARFTTTRPPPSACPPTCLGTPGPLLRHRFFAPRLLGRGRSPKVPPSQPPGRKAAEPGTEPRPAPLPTP